MNLGSDHWMLAKVVLYNKKVSIYDSMVAVCDFNMYKDLFKPLEFIFVWLLKDVRFYNILPKLRSVDPWKIILVKGLPQQRPCSDNCSIFLC